MQEKINASTLNFLSDLELNNNREWFQENKDRYQLALDNFKSFVGLVETELTGFDAIEKTKVFRIYRDVRFSKDKTPYKTNFSAGFTRAGKYRRGGFFLKLEKDSFYVAGGFWNPNKDDLQYIRQGIDSDATDLKKAINHPLFIQRFGKLEGEELKSAPRGYDKSHPELDLLRKKQFLVSSPFSKQDLFQDHFEKVVAMSFKAMIPMFDAIRDMLIYDGNGEERD